MKKIDEIKASDIAEKLGPAAPDSAEDIAAQMRLQLDAKLEDCPTGPGVYIMKGLKTEVLYVGKAKSLRPRVRSYFQKQGDHSAKTVHLVRNVYDIEYMQTGSEVEALLLENNLIKKWKPKYNIRMRDDKTYPYIKLDRGHPFPRGYVARKQLKGDGNLYFGPFPNSYLMRQKLQAGSKLFQLRDCRDHEFSNRSRPCLSYEIGQCTAPCVKYVTETEYGEQVENFVRFLRGETDEIVKSWRGEMETASEALDFERAARVRDRIRNFEESALEQEQRIVNTNEMSNRDIWAFWPPLGGDRESEASADIAETSIAQLAIVVLQIRDGKWVGRSQRSADLKEVLEGEDLLDNILLQYYTKQPLPDEILLPPEVTREKAAPLREALIELAKKMDLADAGSKKADIDESFARDLKFLSASDTEEISRIWELAQQNAKAHFIEVEALRVRKEDALDGIARLLSLPERPERMECIDVSNFQGEANVASCVVFIGGKPDKSHYRHYKIQGFSGQNDFASMKEVMARRFGKPDSPRPDLLVIDGGRGQLSSVQQILNELGCDFPVVGLAKARTERDFTSEEVKSSEERIFVPGQKNPLKIRNAEALKVLTQLRDEAHRFAIEFHRKKRSEARGL